ncbi:MAG: acetyl/propionyl/methylcrotonyl-CoA carboxylase subunit alpha [Rhodospirillales bacterium]|nr:MAG: acetyl/propionyl/methylcrotonyl-CoA carboxylase subunit alpha [Rhodospirillales bacterium]
MFNKILIANRGEIVLRIARTAKRLGIPTVAVYSDADAYARHVSACDEAVRLGPPPVRESYLATDKIIAACKRLGVDAVHPGYGFLSENAEFAKTLAQHGITFIGPDPEVVALMGDKIMANRSAKAAGVPTVPGHWEPIASADEAVAIGLEIGLPVMLKAAAGGGGKGIRIARTESDLRDAFRLARSEAQSAFGDDRVFIEKFIIRPRHIEIQVLGDRHGNVIHLGERECSIQRRHQKVIEEAPSPFVDEEMRQAMGGSAVALSKSVGYSSAGTVELIVGQDRSFYFLEMNTRLQVEHSVTEYINDIDIVEWMIRIAAGEELDRTQDDVRLNGWSVEARIYAEDPNRNFMPSIGRLVRCRMPEDTDQLRVDSGVYEGSEISHYYDPMIAKVTSWDLNRDSAITRIRRALDEIYIKGVTHNVEFVATLMANPRFLAGDISTSFIEEEYPDGFVPASLQDSEVEAVIAAAVLMHLRYLHRMAHVTGALPGYRRQIGHDWVVVVDGAHYPVSVTPVAGRGPEEGFDIDVSGHLLSVHSDWQVGDPVLRCTVNAKPQRFTVERNGLGYRLHHMGAETDVVVYRTSVAALAKLMPERKAPDMSKYLLSPMPGMLKSMAREEGEKVGLGDEIAVVEAMKMENIIRADTAGTIAKFHVKPGEPLSVGQIIAEFA